MNKLEEALKIAKEALLFYKQNTVYYYTSPASDWGTECSDVAAKALNQINNLDYLNRTQTLDPEAD